MLAAAPPAKMRSIALDPQVRESSGLAASAAHAGVMWTHGDSGNPPVLFAVDAETGRVIRAFEIAAKNVDWEDIALAPAADGPDCIYLADVGNNNRDRTTIEVIVLDEPDPRAADGATLRPRRVLKLRYPAGVPPFDCEALFVAGDCGYLIDKNPLGGRARVFSFNLDPDKPFQTLAAAGELPERLPVTGADLSRDGRTLVISTVAGPRVLDLAGGLGDLGKATAKSATYLDVHLEAAAVAPGGVAATTEGGRLLFFPWELFR